MTTSHDIDRMIADLKAAGWKPKTSVIWKSPSGSLHLGPAGAWRTMKRLEEAERLDAAFTALMTAPLAEDEDEEPDTARPRRRW